MQQHQKFVLGEWLNWRLFGALKLDENLLFLGFETLAVPAELRFALNAHSIHEYLVFDDDITLSHFEVFFVGER